jgi:O-antigen/teichoic acid export membrane protein
MIKENLARLLKGTWIYGTGRTIGLVLSFLMLPVFTSYLTPKDYGIISILGFITFLVNPVFGLGFGVSMGLVYFDGDDEMKKHETTWTAFILLLISSIILVCLGFAFSRQISFAAFQTDIYERYIRLYVIVAALGIVILPFQQFLQFEEKAMTFVAITLVSSVITICLNLFFVVFMGRGVEGWITGTLFGALATFILFFSSAVFSVRFRLNMELGMMLLRHGYPVIPAFAFLFIMGSSGKYILQIFRGLEEVGIYTIGYNMGNIMLLAASAFKSAWYPFFQSFVNEKEKAKILFGKAFTYYIFGFGALSLMFFIFARPVTMIMTRPAFHESYKVVGLVALAQFFTGVSSIFLTGVYYAKKIHIATIVQFIASIVVIGLNFLLIPPFGFVGAGLAMACGFIFLSFLQEWVNRVRGLWVPDYEWLRAVSFFVLYAAVGTIAVFLGIKLQAAQYLFISPAIALLSIACMWLLLSSEERAFVMNYVAKFRGR